MIDTETPTPEAKPFDPFTDRRPEENAVLHDFRFSLIELTIQEVEINNEQFTYGPIYSRSLVNADERPAKGRANKNALIFFAMPI